MNVQQSGSRYLVSKPYLAHSTKLKRKTLIQSNKLLNFNHQTKHELSSSIIENKSIGKSNPHSFRSLEINNKNRSIDSQHFVENKGLRRVCVRQTGREKEKDKEKDFQVRLGVHPNWKSIQNMGNYSRSIGEKSSRFGVEQVKSCRYKPKLMKRTKVVSSARELKYRNENVSSHELVINEKQSHKAQNIENRCQNQSQQTAIKSTKTRQKRRYLTQISDKQASSMTLIKRQPTQKQKQKQKARQQTRQKIQKQQEKQNITSNDNGNGNGNGNINQISSILDQTKCNHCTRDQQKSILDNIGYLDMLLDHFGCGKQKIDCFGGVQDKPSKKIQIQHNTSQIHEKNNKQNISTCNIHQQIPQQQQQQQQRGQMKKLGVYKLKHRNGKKERIKQLKSNTLIMRSIGKIKHIFPQGFFFDTINTSQS